MVIHAGPRQRTKYILCSVLLSSSFLCASSFSRYVWSSVNIARNSLLECDSVALQGIVMAKSSPEKLARALRANLKRRKNKPAAAPPPNQPGHPRKAPRQSPEYPPKTLG
jgi:hypothetical protein